LRPKFDGTNGTHHARNVLRHVRNRHPYHPGKPRLPTLLAYQATWKAVALFVEAARTNHLYAIRLM
jgi:hypothetical protein